MTTEHTEELKPCPFCGGEAESYAGRVSGLVKCEKCGAEGPLFDTEAEAITAWNTRSLAPQAGEGVEQVAKALCLSNGDDWNREEELELALEPFANLDDVNMHDPLSKWLTVGHIKQAVSVLKGGQP